MSVECYHKWVSTCYGTEIDYECEKCGANLFETYGAEKFQSGELNLEDFYTHESKMVYEFPKESWLVWLLKKM